MTPPPKKSEPPTELPSFLSVGTPATARRHGNGLSRLQKMLEWYDAAAPQLKSTGSTDVGIPMDRLAKELDLGNPKNPHSLRANLVHSFKDLQVDGRTVELALRQDQGKFVFWFHAVPVKSQ